MANPTTTCPETDLLRRFSLGQVREAEAAELEAHLACCPHCVESLHAVRVADTLVDAMRAQSTLSARPKIDERVTQLMHVLKNWKPFTPPPNGTRGKDPSGEESFDFLAPPQDSDEMGRLGGYRILRVLGGGMGVVFAAEDVQLRRQVAVKTLRPALAADANAHERFLREARAAAMIAHDHIVTIYHVGEDRGVPFMVMPCLQGETLEARLRREPSLPVADVVCIARQLADGLAAAHAHGLLHRDVKPGNVWLETAAVDQRSSAVRVKLLDFGLAWAANDAGDAVLTEFGTVVGTPAFMAPEQARGESAEVRSDLFSLGSVIYAMCTGQAPFQAEQTLAVLEKVRTQTPIPVRDVNPAIPQWLADLVARLHAKNPADRPASAAEVGDMLRQASEGAGGTTSRLPSFSRKPNRRWWTIAAVFFGLLGLTLCEAAGVTHWQSMVVSPDNSGERAEEKGDSSGAVPPPPPAPVDERRTDKGEGLRSRADVVISGEAFCETVGKHGNLVSVKGRVEFKAVDYRTDKILAVDRQTALVADLAENIAGKAALEEAVQALAERVLPQILKE